MDFQAPELDDSLLAWDELSRLSHGHAPKEAHVSHGLLAYIRYVESLLATGAVLRLDHAPAGIRATTLPVADLGVDPTTGQVNRELYILNGHAYLEFAPLTSEGPSEWFDVGRVSH